MLDCHTHILPGVDDGARDPEISLELLRRSLSQGVDTLFLTPHFYATETDPERFLYHREQACGRLLEALEQAEPELLKLRLALGAEVCYFPGMGRSKDLERLQLGSSGFLLVELPFGHDWPADLKKDLQDLRNVLGLRLIIAHVERYMSGFFGHKVFNELADYGLIQCNANFFLRPKTQKLALKLLKQGRIQLLASDCHDPEKRPPNLAAAYEVIEENLGRDFCQNFQRQEYRLLGLEG